MFPANRLMSSRFFDPIFAVCMGFSAAALRIKREQTQQFPKQDNSYPVLFQKGLRMSKGYFGI